MSERILCIGGTLAGEYVARGLVEAHTSHNGTFEHRVKAGLLPCPASCAPSAESDIKDHEYTEIYERARVVVGTRSGVFDQEILVLKGLNVIDELARAYRNRERNTHECTRNFELVD